MKMRRISAILLCILILLPVAVSCGSRSGLNALYEGDFVPHEKPALSSATDELPFTDFPQTDAGFAFGIVKDAFAVYDLVSGKTVLEIPDGERAGIPIVKTYQFDDTRCFSVRYSCSDSEGKALIRNALYSADGTLVDSVDSASDATEQPEVLQNLDLLVFHEKIYRCENGAAVFVKNLPAGESVIATLQKKAGDFYYRYNENGFTVYNKNCDYHGMYLYDLAADPTVYDLENGNLLIQYSFRLPDDESTYDCFYSNTKRKLKTVLWNAEKKSAEEIDFPYLILEIAPVRYDEQHRSEQNYGMKFAKSVKNFASLTVIADKRPTETILAVLNNDGSIAQNLTATYPGMVKIPLPFGKDIFSYYTSTDQTFYVDAEGTVLRADLSDVTTAGELLLVNGKILDRSFRVLFDYAAEHYDFVQSYSGIVIFRRESTYYRYTKDGGMQEAKEINEASSVEFEESFYWLQSKDDRQTPFHYYAPDGTCVYRAPVALERLYGYENLTLRYYQDFSSGVTRFVLFRLK